MNATLMNPTLQTRHDSPLGPLLLRKDRGRLSGLWIIGERHMPEEDPAWRRDDAAFDDIRSELDAYFVGTLRAFTVPVFFPGGTDFQRQVWQELTRIPYGETISYGDLARRIARPAAVRAVGAANGQNPISIVVPCHRVIGANGSLTGYGGGLPAKRWLLKREGVPTELF